jgi:hypothetical protein
MGQQILFQYRSKKIATVIAAIVTCIVFVYGITEEPFSGDRTFHLIILTSLVFSFFEFLSELLYDDIRIESSAIFMNRRFSIFRGVRVMFVEDIKEFVVFPKYVKIIMKNEDSFNYWLRNIREKSRPAFIEALEEISDTKGTSSPGD